MNRIRRNAFTLVELLVVIAIIGILVGLLLPAVQQAREAARRMQCTNHLKQLGLAIHNYESTYKKFPNNNPTVLRGDGRRYIQGPWTIAILPFIEQAPLYNQWDQNLGFGEGGNRSLLVSPIPIYHCPSSPVPAVASFPPLTATWSADLAAIGPGRYNATAVDYHPPLTVSEPPMLSTSTRVQAALPQQSTYGFSGITDGTSNTLLFGEVAGFPRRFNKRVDVGDNSPVFGHLGAWCRMLTIKSDATGAVLYGGNCLVNCTNFASTNLYAFHSGGANHTRFDGSVGFVSEGISLDAFYRLFAVSDGLPMIEE